MYKETILVLNESLKRDKSIYKYLLMESIGVTSLATEMITGNRMPIAGLLFASVLGETIVLYRITKKLLKSEKYKYEKYVGEHTEEYLELKKLYNEYIDLISSILLKYKFTSTKELLVALDILLQCGYFSYEKKYEYHKYDESFEYYPDLLGTYIVAGKGVCRHNTAFISDILNKLNINNFKIYTCSPNKLKLKKHATHVLNGIIDNQEKYAYDFANNTFGFIDGNTIVLKSVDRNMAFFNTIVKSNDKYKDIKAINLSFDELKNITLSGIYQSLPLLEELRTIHFNNNELLSEIANKSLKLMPRK